ncbi:hypothetical protein ACFL5V_11070 [Fibrobacterota bacterium]
MIKTGKPIFIAQHAHNALMKIPLISISLIICLLFLFHCGGTSQSGGDTLEVPVDLPEICHGIDFNLNVEMREVCGVKTRKYLSYKNIPQYRLLLRPKGGKVVKKGKEYELRLPKMLPISLPKNLSSKLEFNEEARRQYIKSTWEYHEFFPEDSDERMKIMRITIPLNDGTKRNICYTILPKPQKIRKVMQGYASELKALDCGAFDKLKPEE